MNARERGFTLIEILIALVVFAIVAIGALAALGATTASGFLGAFPTSFTTVRAAKDYTTAATYLQSLQDFIASKGSSAFGASDVGKTYCIGSACSPEVLLPSTLTSAPDYPNPNTLLTQPDGTKLIDWVKLEVLVQRWYWDGTKYSATASSGDYVVMVSSTLTWAFKGQERPPLIVNRFIPCTPEPDDCE